MTSHAASLGELANRSKKFVHPRMPNSAKSAAAHRKIYESLKFSFSIAPGCTAHEVYLAAIAAMRQYEYEPEEFAALKVLVRYRNTMKAKAVARHYVCLRPGLQKALGEDATFTIRLTGTLDVDAGAVVEVREA